MSTTCPACGGAKVFCKNCLRPVDVGDCKRCIPGDPCRTCGGTGEVDPNQLELE